MKTDGAVVIVGEPKEGVSYGENSITITGNFERRKEIILQLAKEVTESEEWLANRR